MKRIILSCVAALALAQEPPKPEPPKRPQPTGVADPSLKRDMANVKPIAVFDAPGSPDWQVVTEDAVWISNEARNTVHRLDAKTNTVAAVITPGSKPCSGLAAGFGSVWVPLCGDKALARIDIATNKVIATIPVGPADSEGGISPGPDGIWMVRQSGDLVRIDPATNSVGASLELPAGGVATLYANDAVWVTFPLPNLLVRVDPKTLTLTAKIRVGPKPRFLTSGGGSIWTLNQGDGTISRVDPKTNQVIATVEAGLLGGGGEIAFGEGKLWVTLFRFPITEIDPATNKVTRQWAGPGGDAIRVGHGSIWLSNLRQGNIWRIDPKTLK